MSPVAKAREHPGQPAIQSEGAPTLPTVPVSWQRTPDGSPLGKVHTVDAAGQIQSESARRYVEGCIAVQTEVRSLAELLAQAKEMGSKAHRFSGTFEPGMDGKVLHSGGVAPGATKRDLEHRAGLGILPIDIDKGCAPWTNHEEVRDGLVAAVPWLAGAEFLVMDSSSSCITLDGEEVRAPGSFRAYAVVEDATQIPALLKDAHRRCFLAGLGRIVLTEGAALVERSPFDLALRAPTQPDFMVPHLGSPRLSRSRKPSIFPGGRIPASVKLLSPDEVQRYETIVGGEKAVLELAKRAKVEERATAAGKIAHAKLGGDLEKHIATARRAYNTQHLPLDFAVTLGNGQTATVAELLKNPKLAGGGWSIPDPLDPGYGPNKAKLFAGERVIQSLAHGGRKYLLGEDAAAQAPEGGADSGASASVEQSKPLPAHASRTDLANAHRVARHLAGKALHVAGEGWRVWDRKRWVPDRLGLALRLTSEALLVIADEAKVAGSDERMRDMFAWARSSLSKQRITAALDMAASVAGMGRVGEDFDALPWQLNTPAGIVDLHTGTLGPHRPEAMHSKMTSVAYDPAATAPHWDAFLARILPNSTIRAFVQRAVGLSLVGEVREHVLLFAYGTGANGKSTTLNTLRAVFGDYGMAAAGDLLLSRKNDAHKTELVDLQGVRFAVCQEAGEGRSFDEAKVKMLTGGDSVRGNRMHQDNREWNPSHTLWIAANHKPKIQGTDEAIWRRMRIIPFTVQIPGAEQDSSLAGRLLSEGPGILRWAVEGCLAWQRDGLGTPDEVRAATDGYRKDEDLIGDFLAECCFLAPDLTVPRKVLFDAYTVHSKDTGERPITDKAFAAALRERGIQDAGKKGTGRVRTWRGVGLDPDAGRAAGAAAIWVPGQQETRSGIGPSTCEPGSPANPPKTTLLRDNPKHVPAGARTCPPPSCAAPVAEASHQHGAPPTSDLSETPPAEAPAEAAPAPNCDPAPTQVVAADVGTYPSKQEAA